MAQKKVKGRKVRSLVQKMFSGALGKDPKLVKVVILIMIQIGLELASPRTF